MSTLREELKTLTGNKRRFLLLRIADMDTQTAFKLCGITRATYNNWLNREEFVALYRRREEFAGEYKLEAIQLLRRDNQLEAVLLEGRILKKIKEDLELPFLPEGSIVKTNLAREVYSKLISDLVTQPQVPAITWHQKIQQIFAGSPPNQIAEGEMIRGEITEGEVLDASPVNRD